MEKRGRPADMSDLEWLVALEEIRQLKAQRDRYVDAHDWDGYLSLHAPDHVSHHAPDRETGLQTAPWRSSEEMVRNVRSIMDREDYHTVHQSFDPEFIFDTPISARAIWAMSAAELYGDPCPDQKWKVSWGYYHESYEKRDGRWLFTSRRWHRYFGTGSDGPIAPLQRPPGSDAFSFG